MSTLFNDIHVPPLAEIGNTFYDLLHADSFLFPALKGGASDLYIKC